MLLQRNRYKLHQKNSSTVGELWLGLLDFFARYDGTHAITITQKEPLLSTNLRRCARLLNIQGKLFSVWPKLPHFERDDFSKKISVGIYLIEKAGYTRNH